MDSSFQFKFSFAFHLVAIDKKMCRQIRSHVQYMYAVSFYADCDCNAK